MAAVPGGGDLQDQGVERLGEDDRLAAQLYPHIASAGLNMAGGKTADRGRSLCAEQDEQPGDTVLGL